MSNSSNIIVIQPTERRRPRKSIAELLNITEGIVGAQAAAPRAALTSAAVAAPAPAPTPNRAAAATPAPISTPARAPAPAPVPTSTPARAPASALAPTATRVDAPAPASTSTPAPAPVLAPVSPGIAPPSAHNQPAASGAEGSPAVVAVPPTPSLVRYVNRASGQDPAENEGHAQDTLPRVNLERTVPSRHPADRNPVSQGARPLVYIVGDNTAPATESDRAPNRIQRLWRTLAPYTFEVTGGIIVVLLLCAFVFYLATKKEPEYYDDLGIPH